MRHYDCKKYINLDCEKGMCAVCKAIVPIDGEGSDACPNFEAKPVCGTCTKFANPDKYGIGTCLNSEKKSWAYAACDAGTCEKYEAC